MTSRLRSSCSCFSPRHLRLATRPAEPISKVSLPPPPFSPLTQHLLSKVSIAVSACLSSCHHVGLLKALERSLSWRGPVAPVRCQAATPSQGFFMEAPSCLPSFRSQQPQNVRSMDFFTWRPSAWWGVFYLKFSTWWGLLRLEALYLAWAFLPEVLDLVGTFTLRSPLAHLYCSKDSSTATW